MAGKIVNERFSALRKAGHQVSEHWRISQLKRRLTLFPPREINDCNRYPRIRERLHHFTQIFPRVFSPGRNQFFVDNISVLSKPAGKCPGGSPAIARINFFQQCLDPLTRNSRRKRRGANRPKLRLNGQAGCKEYETPNAEASDPGLQSRDSPEASFYAGCGMYARDGLRHKAVKAMHVSIPSEELNAVCYIEYRAETNRTASGTLSTDSSCALQRIVC